jgi:uncharacterized protein (TIGR02117 family)
MKLRKFFLLTSRFLVTAIKIVAITLTVGYLTPRQWSSVSPQPCAFTIYVGGNNVHTNLIVPVRNSEFDWSQELNLAEIGRHRSNNYHFLSFGWGDRVFYLNTPTVKDVKLLTTLRALLVPTDTVVHIQGHFSLPPSHSGYRVKALKVSREGYLKLSEFLVSSLARDSEGKAILIQQSHRYAGSFYEAKGSYSGLKTCNDWTALGLRAAEVNTPVWSGLAGAVFKHLRAGCTELNLELDNQSIDGAVILPSQEDNLS